MSDQFQIMLSNLQNQLSNMSAQQTQQPPQGLNYMQPDILTMIKTVVQSEFAKHGLGQQKPQQPVAAATQNNQQQFPKMQAPAQIGAILPIIGSAYTTEQQEWLSQPQNLLGIPGFLMSNDGKAILNMALETYQQFCNGKPKNDA